MDCEAIALCPFDHIMPRRYTFRLLFFPMAGTQNDTKIEFTFRSGLSSMMEAMPILRGTIKPLSHPLQSGRLEITAPWNDVSDIFLVKDLTQHGICYEELRRRHFPMDAFEFKEVFSVAARRSDPFGPENPVILAQLNFIPGGFILGVCMHHSVLDGQAAVPLIQIWAAHCRGEGGEKSGQPELLSRASLLKQRFSEGTLEDFYEYVYPSAERVESSPKYNALIPKIVVDTEVDTDIFFFASSALRELKNLASPDVMTTGSTTPSWISTNDALAALCYCCITTARLPHPPDPSATIQLAQTLDGRRLMQPTLPPDYLGNVSLFCQIPASYHSLKPSIVNIANLALRIRQRLNEIDSTYADTLLSVLGNVPDISVVKPSFAAGPDKGMMVSSWRQHTFGAVDWGSEIGSRVERMRLPKMRYGRYEGVAIVLPEEKPSSEKNALSSAEEIPSSSSSEGTGWEVMIGLLPEAMERLKQDDIWRRFATWRCR